jgi:hypothetical protein
MMPWRRTGPGETPPAFSRHWWLGGLRNLIWVTLVTILIWVYADMEFIDTDTFSSVTLTLETTSNPKLMLHGPREHTISFEVAGSQASLETLRQQLEEAGSDITYDVTRDYGQGQAIVPLRDLLSKAIDLPGITIESTEPEAITLDLDPMITVADVPVELQWTGAKLEPQPEPQTVNITVPRSRWEQADITAPRLKTQVVDLSRYQSGTQDVRAEINTFIGDVRVTPVPGSVTFRVQIVNPLASEEIPTAVQVLSPSAWGEPGDTTWQEYELIRDETGDSNWRPDLKIVGPRQNLLPENVTAYIQLTEDDKKPVGSWLGQDVKVVFKPGTDLQLQGPPPTVRYKMQKRSVAAPARTTGP